MSDLMEREKLLDDLFSQYDVYQTGELTVTQLREIHGDMRLGSISIPQIEESIKYVCVNESCEQSELFALLQEMDRRHFLVQDLRWEFSLLDTERMNAITEEQARWFVEMVHGQYFSAPRWERFLRKRAIPGSMVTFSEIEVMLCNIPSRDDWLADLEEERQEQQENARQRHELDNIIEMDKERKRRQREEERMRRENDDMRRKLEEDHRNREDENERRQRRRDNEDASNRKRKLEDEEDRGRIEAEERDRKARDKKIQEEQIRKQKEEEELEKLRRLEAQHREEEEARRRQELKEASDFEAILKEVTLKEQEAAAEAARHRDLVAAAGDDQMRKHAAEHEERARLKQKEFSNKRLRYNLKVAIRRRDRNRLYRAMTDFKKAQLPDDDQDLPKAEKILREMQARDGLNKAMASRNLKELEGAISYVKRNKFEVPLQKEMFQAHKVLLQLRRLERIRAEILELKQATVAEIRSYQKPPQVVHIVMTATFLLLGHKEKETKIWKNVQALVGKTGKEGLKRRCLGCEPLKMPTDEANRAKHLIMGYELDDVRDVSAGAATFYLWSWTMIEEAEAQREALKQEEEERIRLLEEKRQKRLEILAENPDATFSDDEDKKPTTSANKKGKTPPGDKKRDSTPTGRSRFKTTARTPGDKLRSKSLDSKSVERGQKKTGGKQRSTVVTSGDKKHETPVAPLSGGSVTPSDGEGSATPSGGTVATSGGDSATPSGDSVTPSGGDSVTPSGDTVATSGGEGSVATPGENQDN